MKNQNIVFIAIAFALAFALAPVTKAATSPVRWPPPPTGPEAVEFPVITIHSTGDVSRGKTGSFVLGMEPVLMFGGTYVNFSVSGTAVPGVDYVPIVSPAYIEQSGYGVVLVQTLPDRRGSSFHQAYSVVITLNPGPGYAVGQPSSAQIMIKP
jgi:hypothetical protein